MRYFTKEWYELMQRQHYTMGMKKLPDKVYSDQDIAKLYYQKRRSFIARERRCYDTPPPEQPWADMPAEDLAEFFAATDWRDIAELTGSEDYPRSPEELPAYFHREHERNIERWQSRPPFDSEDEGRLFDQMYQNSCKYAANHWPSWVLEATDPRLLALDMLPQSVYKRLKKEEAANRRAWNKIEAAAEKELSRHRQILPSRLIEGFRFHDGQVLALRKQGRNMHMLLNTEGAGSVLPYTRVIFRDIRSVRRERGLYLRPRRDENGVLRSNCWYLYDELYAVDEPGFQGVEAHMLLSTNQLKYLTISCRDIDLQPAEDLAELA